MLVIKLELEKNKENYRAVMAALEEFDIAYASWEDGSGPRVEQVISGKTDPTDQAAQLSAAVNNLRRRLGY